MIDQFDARPIARVDEIDPVNAYNPSAAPDLRVGRRRVRVRVGDQRFPRRRARNNRRGRARGRQFRAPEQVEILQRIVVKARIPILDLVVPHIGIVAPGSQPVVLVHRTALDVGPG